MKTYRDPKTGKFCKREVNAVATNIGRDPKTGRFITKSSCVVENSPEPEQQEKPVPGCTSNEDINKLTNTLKTLENKIQELEKKLSGIETDYDTVIDWTSQRALIETTGRRESFSRELDVLPYNTVIKIAGNLKVDIYNEQTKSIYLQHSIWSKRVMIAERGCLPTFRYEVDNEEFILIPAFHKATIYVDSEVSAYVVRYACVGSKELRRRRNDAY